MGRPEAGASRPVGRVGRQGVPAGRAGGGGGALRARACDAGAAFTGAAFFGDGLAAALALFAGTKAGFPTTVRRTGGGAAALTLPSRPLGAGFLAAGEAVGVAVPVAPPLANGQGAALTAAACSRRRDVSCCCGGGGGGGVVRRWGGGWPPEASGLGGDGARRARRANSLAGGQRQRCGERAAARTSGAGRAAPRDTRWRAAWWFCAPARRLWPHLLQRAQKPAHLRP